MIKEIDKRNFAAFAEKAEKFAMDPVVAEEIAFNKSIGNMAAMSRLNSWTGNTTILNSEQPTYLEGSLIEKAMSYLEKSKESFGFEATEVASYSPDPYIALTSTGHAVVNTQQVYKGIPVFLVNKAVIFNKDGGVEGSVGDSVNFTEEVDIVPKVTVLEAAVKAAECITANLETAQPDGWGEILSPSFGFGEKFEPKKLIEFQNITCRPTVLDKSIFANHIRAHLVIFYQGPQAVLGWYFTLDVDDQGLQCDVVISANDPGNIEALYLKPTSHTIIAKGKVHKRNGSDPKEWVDFPLGRNNYPIPGFTQPSPFKEWVAADETRGVNVIAALGNTITSLKGALNGQNLSFEAATDADQCILNMFYFCNFMHDFFYLLGFDEKAGSFDGDDPVLARAHNQAVQGTANMNTPVDGRSPVMNMGIYASTGKHTAVDADVVFHEYVHGVSNRLVGGRTNDRALQEEQSRAMGEGWSDYFALTIQNYESDTEKVHLGSWIKGNGTGIRSRAYDDNFDLTYGSLPNLRGEHSRGEVWCATLMHWTRHLSNEIGKQHAYYICWQSVIDGLKLMNANPSFLDGRDGILRALINLRNSNTFPMQRMDAAINQCRSSFAKFGMGVHARSNGPWVYGISEDFTKA